MRPAPFGAGVDRIEPEHDRRQVEQIAGGGDEPTRQARVHGVAEFEPRLPTDRPVFLRQHDEAAGCRRRSSRRRRPGRAGQPTAASACRRVRRGAVRAGPGDGRPAGPRRGARSAAVRCPAALVERGAQDRDVGGPTADRGRGSAGVAEQDVHLRHPRVPADPWRIFLSRSGPVPGLTATVRRSAWVPFLRARSIAAPTPSTAIRPCWSTHGQQTGSALSLYSGARRLRGARGAGHLAPSANIAAGASSGDARSARRTRRHP